MRRQAVKLVLRHACCQRRHGRIAALAAGEGGELLLEVGLRLTRQARIGLGACVALITMARHAHFADAWPWTADTRVLLRDLVELLAKLQQAIELRPVHDAADHRCGQQQRAPQYQNLLAATA